MRTLTCVTGACTTWRRTVATGMQAAGVPPHTVAAVLGHAPGGLFGVTAVYLRDKQEEAKHAAMDAWDRRLREILGISALPEASPA